MTMKPSYTQPSTASQIVPLRHWKTGGALNEGKEDYSACMLRIAEQSLLRL